MKRVFLFTSVIAGALLASCGSSSKTVSTSDKEKAAEAGKGSVTYTVDASQSEVAWVGKKVGGQHNGTLGISGGDINVENGELKAGKFTLDMNTIKVLDITDAETNGKLVGHLASPDFFDVANNPTGTFEITGVEKLAQADANGNTHNIKGNLTLKGISKNITIPAKVNIQNKSLTANATFAIDRTEWKIMYNSGKLTDTAKDRIINDAVDLDLKLVATAK